MSTRTRLTVSGIMVALALALTGCGDGDNHSEDRLPTTAPTVDSLPAPDDEVLTIGPEPTASISPSTSTTRPVPAKTRATGPKAWDGKLPYASRLELKEGRFRAEVTIRQADVVKVKSGKSNNSAVLTGPCSINVKHDVVVPFTITLTNRSASAASFQLNWALKRNGEPDDAVRKRVDMAVVYTTGGSQTCTGDDDWTDVRHEHTLRSGKSITVYGFVLLQNYVNQSYPTGDMESAKDTVIGIGRVIADGSYLVDPKLTGNMRELIRTSSVNYGVSVIPSATNSNYFITR